MSAPSRRGSLTDPAKLAVLHEGYLTKRAIKRGWNWRKRYFELNTYTDDPGSAQLWYWSCAEGKAGVSALKAAGEQPRGVLLLEHDTTVQRLAGVWCTVDRFASVENHLLSRFNVKWFAGWRRGRRAEAVAGKHARSPGLSRRGL